MIGFDIEIADVFDLAPDEDLDSRGPFRIAVAAIHDASDGSSRVWHAVTPSGAPGGELSPTMAREVLEHLRSVQRAGRRVVAWNGLSFDLKWMGHAAGDRALAAEVAEGLVDPMFHVFCLKGYPISLQAAADGMAIGAKKLMDGKDAPLEWQRGNCQRVLDYVVEDCRITTAVARAIEDKRCVRWRTRRGTMSDVPIPKLLTVAEARQLPDPDTSWMSNPIPRARFVGWLKLGADARRRISGS